MDNHEIIALRRMLHRHPEPAFMEIHTAAVVLSHLQDLGCQVRTGKEAMVIDGVTDYPTSPERSVARDLAVQWGAETSAADHLAEFGTAVVAEFDGKRPGPTWAFRFDMDALPIQESESPQHAPHQGGYRSAVDGMMHACGHDGHVAIGLGLAHHLAEGDFAGTVRLLFQPAEEGCRGARAMIDAGALDGIDRLVAVHLGLGHPSGTLVPGSTGSFATSKFRITFTGRAAHASLAPEHGRNALLAACTASLGIMAMPRWAGVDTRVNVGTLHAGDGVNIVPARAVLVCEARATRAEVNDSVIARIHAIVEGAAAMQQVEVQIEETGKASTLVSDEELTHRIAAATPPTWRSLAPQPMTGSDDASLLIDHVRTHGGQAAYTVIGASSPAPHHTPEFDIDDSVLAPTTDMLLRLIRQDG